MEQEISNLKRVKRTARKYGEFSACVAIPQRYAGMQMYRIVDENTATVLFTPVEADPARVVDVLGRMMEVVGGAARELAYYAGVLPASDAVELVVRERAPSSAECDAALEMKRMRRDTREAWGL